MLTCPKCQAEIDNDSCFCDQCGAELFICPKCGILGKGKRCTRCGEPLVAVKDLGKAAGASKPGAPSPTTSPAASPSAPSSAPASSTPGPAARSSITTDIDKLIGNLNYAAPAAGATLRPGAPQPVSQPAAQRQIPGHLVCRNPQLRLYIDEVIIGRREGGYASVFGAFGMVSGRHAQISRTPSGGWQVMDLGSTNGTCLNGTPLTPNVPAPFWVGDTITFADMVFEALP